MFRRRSYMGIWDSIKMLLIFLFFNIGFGIAIIFIFSGTSVNIDNPILSLLPSALALLIVLRRARSKNGITVRGNLNIKKRDRKLYIPMIVFIIGLNIIVSYLVDYIETIIPISERWTEIFEQAFGQEANFVGVLLLTIIVAPIIEETLFRGIILKGLLGKYSAVTSILVSSLLFGVFHGNIYQFTSALIVGSFLGWLFVKTKSLLLCMIAHGAFNAVVFLSDYFLSQLPNYSINAMQPLWFNIIGVLLVFVGGISLSKKSKKTSRSINY